MQVWFKALLASVGVCALAGCAQVGLAPAAIGWGGAAPPAAVSLAAAPQDAADCEVTWAWSSRYGDFSLSECARGRRYLVALADRALDRNPDAVAWRWRNCSDSNVTASGDDGLFFTYPPHPNRCNGGGYYLVLTYRDGQGQRYWDGLWFEPGKHFK